MNSIIVYIRKIFLSLKKIVNYGFSKKDSIAYTEYTFKLMQKKIKQMFKWF